MAVQRGAGVEMGAEPGTVRELVPVIPGIRSAFLLASCDRNQVNPASSSTPGSSRSATVSRPGLRFVPAPQLTPFPPRTASAAVNSSTLSPLPSLFLSATKPKPSLPTKLLSRPSPPPRLSRSSVKRGWGATAREGRGSEDEQTVRLAASHVSFLRGSPQLTPPLPLGSFPASSQSAGLQVLVSVPASGVRLRLSST